MSKTKKTILVTGTGGRSVGAGILHALIRSNREVSARWDVIAADADSFAWGLYKTRRSLILPRADQSDYIQRLNKVIGMYDVDAVIPGTQAEVEIISNSTEQLIETAFIINRKELVPLMMNKFLLKDVLDGYGIKFIETRSLDNWKSVANSYGFPVIVKPAKDSGGSRGVQIVCNEDDMVRLISKSDNFSFCVQPYMGTADAEYTVGVLNDKNGNLIDSIVMKRKLRGLSLFDSKILDNKQFSISSGYSQGFIIKDQIIQEFCEDLALKLESVGPLNIQLRIHNGVPCVFEIHPRFSGTTPIRADVGFNEVDILLRNYLFDEPFSKINYKYNIAAIRAFEHVLVPMKDMTI